MWNTCVPLVFLVTGVATQCGARGQIFNAPLHDPSTVTEEIKPLQLLEDLFTFFRLMRNEFYYSVSENITMTTAGDPGCSVIGRAAENIFWLVTNGIGGKYGSHKMLVSYLTIFGVFSSVSKKCIQI